MYTIYYYKGRTLRGLGVDMDSNISDAAVEHGRYPAPTGHEAAIARHHNGGELYGYDGDWHRQPPPECLRQEAEERRALAAERQRKERAAEEASEAIRAAERADRPRRAAMHRAALAAEQGGDHQVARAWLMLARLPALRSQRLLLDRGPNRFLPRRRVCKSVSAVEALTLDRGGRVAQRPDGTAIDPTSGIGSYASILDYTGAEGLAEWPETMQRLPPLDAPTAILQAGMRLDPEAARLVIDHPETQVAGWPEAPAA